MLKLDPYPEMCENWIWIEFKAKTSDPTDPKPLPHRDSNHPPPRPHMSPSPPTPIPLNPFTCLVPPPHLTSTTTCQYSITLLRQILISEDFLLLEKYV